MEPSVRARFGELVRSPYFNKREKLVRLTAYLEWVGENNWNRHNAFAAIFGEVPYRETVLNNLLSDLYKLAEKFLALYQLEQDPGMHHLLLMEKMVATGDQHLAEKVLVNKKHEADEYAFYQRFSRHMLLDRFHFQHARTGNNADLEAGRDALEQFYLVEQLKIWCELLNRSQVLGAAYDGKKLEAFNSVLNHLAPNYASNPFVILFIPVFNWLQDPDDDGWYPGYMQKLPDHLKEIPAADARELCNYIQNYCVRRINQSRTGFLNELFQLFKIMLQLDLLKEGNYITQWTFKNIVTVGVRLKEFSWTETFIHTHYLQLAPDERDNAYQYNLSVFYYESGDTAKAQQLLNKVLFTDPVYYLDAKCILLKIYYEADLFDPLMSLRDATKIYLLRNKQLNKEQKSQYSLLMNYTLQLYKLRTGKGAIPVEKWNKDFRRLLHNIAHKKLIANKQWLQQKVNDLLAAR